MGNIKYWTGSSWTSPDSVRYYDGSNWNLKVGKYWTGSEWEAFNRRMYILDGTDDSPQIRVLTDSGADINDASSGAKSIRVNPQGELFHCNYNDYIVKRDSELNILDAADIGASWSSLGIGDWNDSGNVWFEVSSGNNYIIKHNFSSQIWQVNTGLSGYSYNITVVNSNNVSFTKLFKYVTDGDNQSRLVKTTSGGGLDWVVDVFATDAEVHDLACDGTGGVYTIELVDPDSIVRNINKNGNTDWSKTWSGYWAESIAVSKNYVYVAASEDAANPNERIKIYEKGSGSVHDTLDITSSGYDIADTLEVDSDENLYLSTDSGDVLKVDENGNVKWSYSADVEEQKNIAVDFGTYGAFPDQW